jgi:hypothetical protein
VRSIVFTLGMTMLASGASLHALERQPACDGLDTSLSSDRRQEYAALVARAVAEGVRPSGVKIHRFMAIGAWSAVSVSTPVTDDGYLFFQETDGRKQFRDVWGGWADPSEKPELIKWVTNLGAPERLAACFADTATRH